MADLLALTLHQPWAWWMASGVKPIENRDWAPPVSLIGKPLALHAGKTYDEGGDSWIRSKFPGIQWPVADHRRHGQILAVAKVVGVIAKQDRHIECPGVVYVERGLKDGLVKQDELRWFFGEYGWVLRDVVLLPRPIPCRGFQKLWGVPPGVLPQVREQFKAARAQQKTAGETK